MVISVFSLKDPFISRGVDPSRFDPSVTHTRCHLIPPTRLERRDLTGNCPKEDGDVDYDM